VTRADERLDECGRERLSEFDAGDPAARCAPLGTPRRLFARLMTSAPGLFVFVGGLGPDARRLESVNPVVTVELD